MDSTPLSACDIDSYERWHDHISTVASLRRCTIQSLDLSDEDLSDIDMEGAVFLGCQLPSGMIDTMRQKGALIFPAFDNLPFNAYRSHLYEADELYDAIFSGNLYADTADARIYSWTRSLHTPSPIHATLAMSLHDHAISTALEEYLRDIDFHSTVGVMGGHAYERGSDDYVGAVRLGSQLALHGFTVLTGGGPGAMEATNLGAYLAGRYPVLVSAIDHLASIPTFHTDSTAWVASALEIRAQFPPSAPSISVPTWYYGHEPSNVFSTHIAKYFSNAIREDMLLQQCRAGIVFLPGAAGTVQEIFQAATSNFYCADPEKITPMIFVGKDHWLKDLPAWPLLSSLASGRMSDAIALVDDIDDAVAWLNDHRNRRQHSSEES